ncbi:MAG TPA: sigma 54-interacting transcriptional regulator [Clostridia bacterium]|nr:sigma 54-interacting transcriptional regulator [Clostridia bacterium]
MDPGKVVRLISLPEGSPVLIASNLKETAAETRAWLVEYGMDHLKYELYYPGMTVDLRRFQAVVVAGMPHFAPTQLGEVSIIDIGEKLIDPLTVVEIHGQLGLATSLPKKILESKARISGSAFSQLCKHLRTILNAVDEAVVAVDSNNRVIVFNSRAERLFNIDSSKVVWTDAAITLPELRLGNTLRAGTSSFHECVSIGGKRMYSDKILLTSGQTVLGAVAIIRKIYKVENTGFNNVVKSQNSSTARYRFCNIVGRDLAFRSVVKRAVKFARSAPPDMAILITGESGTGKELLASSIHNLSDRKLGPFIPVNLATLPESLASSELFGYEDGAFTGSKKGGQAGLFEQAQHGTLFLDEIEAATIEIQTKLLRVLEERKIRRLGGLRQVDLDVRIIAASNEDLLTLVHEGKFRHDLYFRLNVLRLHIPPLRERKEDIPLLVEHFLKEFGRDVCVDHAVLSVFREYDWPGNVRELRNVLQYASVVSDGKYITLYDLPPWFGRFEVDKARIETGKATRIEPLETLLQEFNLREVLELLRKLSRCKRGVGRREILKNMNDVNTSEYRIRRLLKFLEDFGYVRIGKTRQGTTITSVGIKALTYLEHIPILEDAQHPAWYGTSDVGPQKGTY